MIDLPEDYEHDNEWDGDYHTYTCAECEGENEWNKDYSVPEMSGDYTYCSKECWQKSDEYKEMLVDAVMTTFPGAQVVNLKAVKG